MTYEFMDPLDVLIDKEEQRSEHAELVRDLLQVHTKLLRYLK